MNRTLGSESISPGCRRRKTLLSADLLGLGARPGARAVSSPLKEVAMLRVGLILPAGFHVMSYATLATFDAANSIAGE
jgi:hypothetical protein